MDKPLTVYCPDCGAYVFLLGDEDYQCDCGCVFDLVQENGEWIIDVKEPSGN